MEYVTYDTFESLTFVYEQCRRSTVDNSFIPFDENFAIRNKIMERNIYNVASVKSPAFLIRLQLLSFVFFAESKFFFESTTYVDYLSVIIH